MSRVLEIFFKLPGFLQTLMVLFICLAALFFAILITFLIIRGVYKIPWQNVGKTRWITLENKGNVINLFRFRAESEKKGKLRFRFSLNDQPLPEVDVEKIEYVDAPRPSAKQKKKAQKAGQAVNTQPNASQSGSGLQDAGSAAGQAKDGAMDAVNKGRQAASLLGTVGGLLPGEAGSALRQQSSVLQVQTSKASSTLSVPDQKMGEVRAVKSQSANLSGKKKTAQPVNQAMLTAASKPRHVTTTVIEEEQVDEQKAEEVRKIPRSVKYKFVETPPIYGGEKLQIKMDMQPGNLYKTREHHYVFESQHLVQEDGDFVIHQEDKKANQLIHIRGIGLGFRILNFLFCFLVSTINIVWVVFFIRWVIITLT